MGEAMRFFFYGTLVAGRGNAVAARAHARLGPGVPGVAEGRLYAISDSGGWYPALVRGGGRKGRRGLARLPPAATVCRADGPEQLAQHL